MAKRLEKLVPFRGRAEDSNFSTGEYVSSFQDQTRNHVVFEETEPTIAEWAINMKPSHTQIVDYVASLFPFSRWITSYNLQWLAGDLVAGITVGAVVIPQGMAYAKLAQLPVQFGLYSSFMGALVYWIFGTSKDINIGPVAVASIVTATIVAEARKDIPDVEPFIIASALAFLTGAVILLMGLLRIGWLVDLISLAAVSAFITGSAITIVAGQISTLLGIHGIDTRDPAYKIAIATFKHLGQTKLDAAMGVTALAVLYGIRIACSQAQKRYPTRAKFYFFLSTLRTVFVILLFTLISFLVNRQHQKTPKFSILGHIPRGFRKTAVPDLDGRLVKALSGQVPAAIIVLVIEHISIAKSFGRINNYTINPSQELIAIGATNMLGPFLGAYMSTGSCSRTAIKSKCGVRTPFAGVITAGVVLLALYTLTPVFFFVPNASLAGVIIHAVGDLVTPPTLIWQYWKISPLDVLIFFTGVFITVFDSIETGVFATIGLSVAVLLYRIFRAQGQMLGTAKVRSQLIEVNSQTLQTGTSVSRDISKQLGSGGTGAPRSVFLPLNRSDGSNPQVRVRGPAAGIFIYRLLDGLNYQNANHQLDQMVDLILEQARPTTTVTFAKKGDRSWNDPSFRRGFRSRQSDDVDARPTLKAVILDFSSVNNVDLTSVQVLIDTRTQLDRFAAPDAVEWHFANVTNRWTKRALVTAGFGVSTTATSNGNVVLTQRLLAVGEMNCTESPELTATKSKAAGTNTWNGYDQDIEMANLDDPYEISRRPKSNPDFAQGETVITTSEFASKAPKFVPVEGINYPYFHVDLESAFEVAKAFVMAEQKLGNISGLSE